MDRRGRFRDRAHAGSVLAVAVAERLGPLDATVAVVLGLPRGGVPVAAVVAGRLGGLLDVLGVRKVGAPHHHELAIGAVASGDLVVFNDEVIDELMLDDDAVARRVEVARRELVQQECRLRGDRPRPVLRGRTVVVVDDGLATGATMRAAVRAVRIAGPELLVVAVPVGPPDTCAELEGLADVVVCPHQPTHFRAVGEWYRDFSATTDDDVLRLLAASPSS